MLDRKYWFSHIVLLVLFIPYLDALGQGGFTFTDNAKKTTIPFTLVNNLIVIEVHVNGVPLNFLLDSGVEETLLLDLEKDQEVLLGQVETVSLKGLGSDQAISGLKAFGNTLEIKNLKAENHLMYVVLESNFRFANTLGVPLNGILGYQFFRNNRVEINYHSKKITVHNNKFKTSKNKKKRFFGLPISIENGKPYAFAETEIVENHHKDSLKFLIDTGNSSALWLFTEHPKVDTIPKKRFNDFLGLGFSGPVNGVRARIHRIKVGNRTFQFPVTAFPDQASLANVKMAPNRAGSIGGDLLRRFHLIFDYPNKTLYFKPNSHAKSEFEYNKSGIQLQQAGLRMAKVPNNKRSNIAALRMKIGESDVSLQYEYILTPAFEVAHLRENSPAANAGVQLGDILVSINGKTTAQLTLEEVSQLLKSKREKTIELEVERKTVLKSFRFQLKNILD